MHSSSSSRSKSASHSTVGAGSGKQQHDSKLSKNSGALSSKKAPVAVPPPPPPPSQLLKFRGSAQFRQRIVMATLSNKKIRIDNIRDKDEAPGLREFEASFLRLVEAITNGCRVEINETGTAMRYAPGVIVGGKIEHNCGTSRSIGWFLEGVLPLLPFAKKATTLILTGITSDDADLSVDTLKLTHLPIFPYFGVGASGADDGGAGLSLTVNKRGSPPLGGGQVTFTCPVVRELKPINLIDEGYVKRIRGLAFTTRVSPQVANRITDGARAVLNTFLPDVFIYTDHNKGEAAGLSPGYGVSLVASTTSGCLYGAQRAAGKARGVGGSMLVGAGGGGSSSTSSSSPPDVPEDLGAEAAGLLLDEIARGGCIGTTVQPLVFLLMLLGPPDVSRVRVGALGAAGIATLRLIREFFGIVFKLQPDIQDPVAAPPSKKQKKGKQVGLGGDDDGNDQDGDDDEGTDSEDSDDGGASKKKKKDSKKRGRGGGRFNRDHDDFQVEKTDADANEDEDADDVKQPLTSAIVGGHGGKTILVSCLGIGYKNFAKKVT